MYTCTSLSLGIINTKMTHVGPSPGLEGRPFLISRGFRWSSLGLGILLTSRVAKVKWMGKSTGGSTAFRLGGIVDVVLFECFFFLLENLRMGGYISF